MTITAAPARKAAAVGGLALGRFAGVALVASFLIPKWAFGSSLASLLVPVVAPAVILLLGVGVARRRLRRPRLLLAFTIVMVSGLVGNLLTGHGEGSTAATVAFAILCWLVLGNLTERERVAAARIILVGAVALAGILLVEAFVVGQPLVAQTAFQYRNPFTTGLRAQGTLSQPLVAGYVLIVGGCLAPLAGIPRVGVAALLGLFLLAAVATGSSSVVAAVLVVAAIALIWRGSNTWRVVKFAAVVGAAWFLLAQTGRLDAVLEDLDPAANGHRMNSILSVPNLLTARPEAEVLFGSGWNSVYYVYSSGLIPDDQFYAIDNMFVAVLAFGGLVGAVAFYAITIRGILPGNAPGLFVAFTAVSAMAFGFDFLVWSMAVALYAFIGTWRFRGRPATLPAGLKEHHANPAEPT